MTELREAKWADCNWLVSTKLNRLCRPSARVRPCVKVADDAGRGHETGGCVSPDEPDDMFYLVSALNISFTTAEKIVIFM